jgi:arsenic resistance protein ArsH
MVWTSPERHGAMNGIMKAQIDWIPLSVGAVRPTQGKTLAVMQVSGGSQSFNAVNQLHVLGRWMPGQRATGACRVALCDGIVRGSHG